MRRRLLSVFLALSLFLGISALPARAALPDGREYVEYGWDAVDKNDSAYAPIILTGAELKLYEMLKGRFAEVANGALDSSVFEFNASGLGLYYSNGTLQGAATKSVLTALLADCPYEQYWFDKVKGWSYSIRRNSTGIVSSVTFKCAVTQNYAKDVPGENRYYTYQPDPNKTRAAAAVLQNARAVVNQNSGRSDYEKLAAYRDYICDQVEYNYAAAGTGSTFYGDPWQMIYVFDNNPNTNVVCEGYSKAFKYLCDISTFSNQVDCYLASGYTSGDHMWNIVRINGQNYLADLTACDSKRGKFGDWFLAGAANATIDGFTLQLPRRALGNGSYYQAKTETYTYKDTTKQLYGSGILILSPTSLDPAALSAHTPTPAPAPAPAPVSGLKTDFANLTLHELAPSGYSFDDREYTLGSTGADVSVLVLGSYNCGNTARTLKTVKAELAGLGVRDGRIYLLEVQDEGPAGQAAVRQWAKKNPSYVRVIASASTKSSYNSVFWDITEACDGEYVNGDSGEMPALVVLNKACQPVYYASCNAFDQGRLRTALAPYAGKPFTDVPAGQYYTEAVNWAVSGHVTTGTTGAAFSPKQNCTHAQIITFLWRAMGEPRSASFVPPAWVGVEPGHFAYDALGWAAAKGMLTNLSVNGGPDGYCTRAQAMDYIWAALGRPGGGSASFSDVPSHMYYAGAVAWAVDSRITNGTGGGSFSPDRVCDRGTIVTFLHRAFVEEARLK